MSEPVLKAILQLFALVAKEDEVADQERNQIKRFLGEHLNQKSAGRYIELFDEFIGRLPQRSAVFEDTLQSVERLCIEISPELTQKQKVVFQLELLGIIFADR
jgi:hypothetical protein